MKLVNFCARTLHDVMYTCALYNNTSGDGRDNCNSLASFLRTVWRGKCTGTNDTTYRKLDYKKVCTSKCELRKCSTTWNSWNQLLAGHIHSTRTPAAARCSVVYIW